MKGFNSLRRKKKSKSHETLPKANETYDQLEKRIEKMCEESKIGAVSISDFQEELKLINQKQSSLTKQGEGLKLMSRTYEQIGDLKSASNVKKQIEDFEGDVQKLNRIENKVKNIIVAMGGVPGIMKKAKALFDFEPIEATQLKLQQGDVIILLDDEDPEWWLGEKNGKSGYFPKTYVEILEEKRPALMIGAQKAKALFDYEAKGESELTMKVGDIITLTSVDGEEWWEGELNGNIGFFPKLYVELLPLDESLRAVSITPSLPKKAIPEPKKETVKNPNTSKKVKALFDYEARGPTEISLKSGDVIVLISMEDEEWWEGELNGSVGYFPKLYVQLIDESSKIPAAPQSRPVVVEPVATKKSAKVKFEYIAQGDSELTIKPGEIIKLLSTEDEEWWEGELNGNSGFFPKNYVEILTSDIESKETKTSAFFNGDGSTNTNSQNASENVPFHPTQPRRVVPSISLKELNEKRRIKLGEQRKSQVDNKKLENQDQKKDSEQQFEKKTQQIQEKAQAERLLIEELRSKSIIPKRSPPEVPQKKNEANEISTNTRRNLPVPPNKRATINSGRPSQIPKSSSFPVQPFKPQERKSNEVSVNGHDNSVQDQSKKELNPEIQTQLDLLKKSLTKEIETTLQQANQKISQQINQFQVNVLLEKERNELERKNQELETEVSELKKRLSEIEKNYEDKIQKLQNEITAMKKVSGGN